MTMLTDASNQLFNRSNDEIFETVDSYYEFLRSRAQRSKSVDRDLSKTIFDFSGNTPILRNEKMQEIELTNWSMRQLATELDIPFAYLNKCPQDLAAENVNYFLKRRVRNLDSLYLELTDNRPIVRAITSNQYARIFDYEVAGHLLELGEKWKVPLTWAKEPRGLYAGDRDMFAFMIDGGSFVDEVNVEGAIHRGFFLRNSEVKNGSFSIQTFFHRGVCGNHLVWNASNIEMSRVIHKGDDARSKAFSQLDEFLRVFANTDMSGVDKKIKIAKTIKLGDNEKEVIEAVRKVTGVGKKIAQSSYMEAAMNFSVDGNPNHAWGMAQGLTRHSQTKKNADERMVIDRMAGVLLEKVTS